MSEIIYTEAEAKKLVTDANACTRCRQLAATVLLTNHRHNTGQDDRLHFQATLLHSAGRERHSCGK